MEEQDPPDENHDANDDRDRETNHDASVAASGDRAPGAGLPGAGLPGAGLPGAGLPGDDHGFLSEEFDDCGYVPEEWELEGPAASIGLGDAADLDPALLAAITGPEGLGGNALCQAYEEDAAADVLRPARSFRR